MDPRDKSNSPTLDDPAQGRKPPSVRREENAPTRYVRPHVDHSVENPRPRPPSASQMAARVPTPSSVTAVEEGVRGVLVQADFNDGDFVLRLERATAGMQAMMQLMAARGLEIEIVVRRRG